MVVVRRSNSSLSSKIAACTELSLGQSTSTFNYSVHFLSVLGPNQIETTKQTLTTMIAVGRINSVKQVQIMSFVATWKKSVS